MCPGAPCDAALCHGSAGFSPAPLRSLSTFTRCGLALCGRGLSGGPPAGTARLPGGRCVWPGDHGGAERCRTRAEAEAETSRPLEGRNAGGVWEAGRGPAHAPGRVGTRRRHPNGLAFAGSWGRLLLSRLGGRRPSGGALGSRSAHAGSSDVSERRSAAEAAAARGGAGSSRPGGAARCPRTPRLAHEPRRWAFVPSPRGLRCLLPASRSRPGLGTIAGSEPEPRPLQGPGPGAARLPAPSRRGTRRSRTASSPLTAAWRDAVWRAWLSPTTSAHVFQTLTRGRSHAAFLTENKSYPILRPKGKQDSRRHAAPESRGHVEREASGTAVSPATTTCGTRGAEGGHGGPAGRGHCG